RTTSLRIEVAGADNLVQFGAQVRVTTPATPDLRTKGVIGRFGLAFPATPLGRGGLPLLPAREQVPNTELMTYKVVALARLVAPESNIPATTALATLNRTHGRELGLSRGANVVMPNLTPPRYRVLYEIYPGKACVQETATQCGFCLKERIHRLGRHVGAGPGSRRRSASALPA
ncbi:MAG TPA: hypothetical protein P5079_10070, partial [Elusimicrobiota bacterium]|nr:hypothetical protein [Elusimicrobiota bacterium]